MDISIANENDIDGNLKLKSVAESCLQGILKFTGFVRHEHQHHDECGNRSEL